MSLELGLVQLDQNSDSRSGLACFLSLTHLHTMTRTSSINTFPIVILSLNGPQMVSKCFLFVSRSILPRKIVSCDIFVHTQDGLLCSTAVSNTSPLPRTSLLHTPLQKTKRNSRATWSHHTSSTSSCKRHLTGYSYFSVSLNWTSGRPTFSFKFSAFWASKLLSNFSVVSHSIAFLLWQQKPSAFRLMV